MLQGSGLSWLFPFVDGHPPIGWHDAGLYLVLPALLVLSQFASQKLVTPQSTDPAQQQTQAILGFLPFMIGELGRVYGDWGCVQHADSCRPATVDPVKETYSTRGLHGVFSATLPTNKLQFRQQILHVFGGTMPTGADINMFTGNIRLSQDYAAFISAQSTRP